MNKQFVEKIIKTFKTELSALGHTEWADRKCKDDFKECVLEDLNEYTEKLLQQFTSADLHFKLTIDDPLVKYITKSQLDQIKSMVSTKFSSDKKFNSFLEDTLAYVIGTHQLQYLVEVFARWDDTLYITGNQCICGVKYTRVREASKRVADKTLEFFELFKKNTPADTEQSS